MSVKQGWVDLVSNPLTGKNAHQHKSNHPSGFNELRQYVEFLESQCEYFSLYPHTIRDINVAKSLGIDVNHITAQDLNAIIDYKKNDYESLLCYLADKSAKIVFVKMCNSLPLYFMQSRSEVLPFAENGASATQDQIRERLDFLFFKQSQQHWQNLGLDNLWDQRERRALDIRPFDIKNFDVNLPTTALTINAQDLWHHGEVELIKIMDYCHLPVDSTRIDQWHSVYKSWQKIQLDALYFQNSYQDILKAIVNGYHLSIDLTFDQEIVIQHCLIYQYNLNLKTWGLEKFPNNTFKLHQLLEPNIHEVPNIY